MEGKRRRGEKRGRRKSKEFMDAARQAFVRHLALEKWREMDDMRETLGFDWATAARDAGNFVSRGPYQPLWKQRWEEQVLARRTEADPGTLFAVIEEAVAAALDDEEKERRTRGDRPLDEDPEYRAFIGASLERLFREQAGELEPD